MEQDNKLHFFKRIKVAIFNLEDYGKFLGESGYKAVKYFLLLILLFSCIFGFSKTFYINKGIKKVYNYINNELPSFEYNSNKLHFSQKVEASSLYPLVRFAYYSIIRFIIQHSKNKVN